MKTHFSLKKKKKNLLALRHKEPPGGSYYEFLEKGTFKVIWKLPTRGSNHVTYMHTGVDVRVGL